MESDSRTGRSWDIRVIKGVEDLLTAHLLESGEWLSRFVGFQ